VQNKMVEFMNLYVLWKCTTSNSMIGAKDHLSIQMDVEEVNTVSGRFNGQQLCCGIPGCPVVAEVLLFFSYGFLPAPGLPMSQQVICLGLLPLSLRASE
uniref:Uncharacterized protein n=1 Tax=Urocitellus parryii TaxID=9999 RepID=A0A8D2HC82_UROPR